MSNKQTEVELKKELEIMISKYKEITDGLDKNYKQLQDRQDKLPKKFVDDDDFEDSLILSSQCKHVSINNLKIAVSAYGSLKADLDYTEAQMRIYLAEDFLKDRGFDKITDSLRESFINSFKPIRNLSKYLSKIESQRDAFEKLVRAFESDEVNCRKFLDLKTKLRGI